MLESDAHCSDEEGMQYIFIFWKKRKNTWFIIFISLGAITSVLVKILFY